MTKLLTDKMENEKEKSLPHLVLLTHICCSLTALKIVTQKGAGFVGQSSNRIALSYASCNYYKFVADPIRIS